MIALDICTLYEIDVLQQYESGKEENELFTPKSINGWHATQNTITGKLNLLNIIISWMIAVSNYDSFFVPP